MRTIPCAQAPEAWFSDSHLGVEFAKAQCRARCPLLDECAERGEGEPHGVWGGMSPSDRLSADRQRREVGERELNARIIELRQGGMSVRAMAAELDIPRKTLSDRIKRLELAV
ncbi:WhiB family transcriptional regulator [Streptomyces sp. NPDC006458]|uniref:WhiB family transcriptional regulator n=1 Tax=Streptomyces sp. NPDC006458 TaxID=3154302 RepID=UPI0033BADD28